MSATLTGERDFALTVVVPLERTALGSFQEFQQLVCAATDDFSAGVPCDAGISFKPSKDASAFVADHFTVA